MKKRSKAGMLVLAVLAAVLMVFYAQSAFADDGSGTDAMDTYVTAADSSSPTLSQAYKDASKNAAGSSKAKVLRESSKPYYYIDMEDASWITKPGANIMNTLANTVFSINKEIAGFTADITEASMDFDLFKIIEKPFSAMFAKLKSLTSWSGPSGFLILLGIGMSLLFALILFARGNLTEGFGKVMKIILVLVLTALFFYMPMSLLSMGAGLTKQIGGQILTSSSGNSSVSVGEKGSSTVWNIMVDLPWQSVEFGKVVHASSSKGGGMLSNYNGKSKEDQLFDTHPDDRSDDVSTLSATYPLMKASATSQTTRFGIVFLMGLINLLLGAGFLILNLLLIATQFLVVVFAFMGIVVLLLALFPQYGVERVQKWAGYLLIGFVMQIIVYFAFCLIFLLMNIIYSTMLERLGVLMTGFIVIALFSTFLVFRHQIMDIIGLDRAAGAARTARSAPVRLRERTRAAGIRAEKVRSAVSRTSEMVHRRKESESGRKGSEKKAYGSDFYGRRESGSGAFEKRHNRAETINEAKKRQESGYAREKKSGAEKEVMQRRADMDRAREQKMNGENKAELSRKAAAQKRIVIEKKEVKGKGDAEDKIATERKARKPETKWKEKEGEADIKIKQRKRKAARPR